jgi:outer membrane cobalamin receptor
MRQFRLPLLSLAVSVVALSGCAYLRSSTPATERPDRKLITAEDIAGSGTNNAWDLLRAKAPGYDFAEDRQGRPRAIRTRRGRSTLNMSSADMPLIVIDGARLTDVATLRDLPVQAIQSVELLGGIAATAAQGTNASAGLIYIHTWEASSGPIAKRN